MTEDQSNTKQSEHDPEQVKDLVNRGKDLIEIKRKITHTEDDDEVEKMMKEIDVFDHNLKEICPIVPGRSFLSLVTEVEFEAAVWILERYSHIIKYPSPMSAYEILIETQEDRNYLEIICDAALIFKALPKSLIMDNKPWILVAQAMAERAKHLLDYILTPSDKPTDFISVLTVNDVFVSWEEYRLKRDLGVDLNQTNHFNPSSFEMVVSRLCGGILEQDFLPKIYPSPEFQNLEISPLPKLEDGRWIKGLQEHRTWWNKFENILSSNVIDELDISTNNKCDNYIKPGNDIFEICYKNKRISLKASKGIQYIHYLIKNMGKFVNVTKIESLGGPTVQVLSSPDGVVNQEGKDAIKKKIQDLDMQYTQAKEDGDGARAAEIEDELQQVQEQSNKDKDIRGQSRPLGDTVEEARNRVSKAIRDTLNTIKDDHIELHEHLRQNIKSPYGRNPGYLPSDGIQWQTK